jgi:hypothetical protein
MMSPENPLVTPLYEHLEEVSQYLSSSDYQPERILNEGPFVGPVRAWPATDAPDVVRFVQHNGNDDRPDSEAKLRDAYPSYEDSVLARADELDAVLAELKTKQGVEPTPDPVAAEVREEVAALTHFIAHQYLLEQEQQTRDAFDHITDLLELLTRRVERVALDDPQLAIMFVTRQLERADRESVASLLNIDAGTIQASYEGADISGRVAAGRARLTAQLIYDLRNSLTRRGIIRWFGRQRYQLDGKTPLEVLNDRPEDAEALLRPLARAGRGQLAT